jgi:predicted CXXCH cytochrome family protein
MIKKDSPGSMNPKHMHTIFRLLSIIIGGGVVMLAAAADIRATKHNLTGLKDVSKLDERKVCVFCHTPEVAIGDTPGEPVKSLWQSSSAKDQSFIIYDDIGRLGLGKSSVGSQSIACLSCHDSAQAFGVGKSSEDHPFGVPYRGSLGKFGVQPGVPVSENGQPFDGIPRKQAAHLKGLEDFRPVSRGRVENRTVWWVSANGQTARRSRSDLPLYARNEEGSGTEIPHIECSSCHDPHSTNETFLRVPNEGSKLCLTCHDK